MRDTIHSPRVQQFKSPCQKGSTRNLTPIDLWLMNLKWVSLLESLYSLIWDFFGILR